MQTQRVAGYPALSEITLGNAERTISGNSCAIQLLKTSPTYIIGTIPYLALKPLARKALPLRMANL